MKTNKAYTKRLRVTKKGKVLGRVGGLNHFNARKQRVKQLSKRKNVVVKMTNKTKSRFLTGTK
jgi:ribosomal protein L35